MTDDQQDDSSSDPVAPLDLDATEIGEVDQTTSEIIDRYKLLKKIGEGGMGSVWMAEQTSPVRRTVALKIIKAGMDTQEVIARFEIERQALALMDHPNIAKVLDGGETPSGRPYFVMELVKGVPITKFCDHECMTMAARLELFVSVCQAVQHAHQKGVIHRDLKPSNVLVTLQDGQPFVKVIDFGLAKATGQRLTAKTLFTELGQLVGTLEYMSPEQAELNQLDIDTRSDIYALGAMLYELLTGTTPISKEQFRELGFSEMLRTIREDDPPKPSMRFSDVGDSSSVSAMRRTEPAKLSKIVRGELDWIVMKALEKHRSRRYETASGLAADIERYLHHEPVLASPPSASYRLQKFARRNRVVLVTSALVVAAMATGTVTSLWQARVAWGEASRANRAEGVAELAKETAQEQARLAREAAVEEAKANAKSQRYLYAAHMTLAKQYLDRGRLGDAIELLERHAPQHADRDLRGFEWHYLWDTCHAELDSLQGHAKGVLNVAYSADGQFLASASEDKTVRVWDIQTRTVRAVLKGHTAPVNQVAFSPDGHLLGSASRDGTVVLWNWKTQAQAVVLEGHKKPVNALAFAPDGSVLVSGAGAFNRPGGEVRVWELPSGEPARTLTGHKAAVTNVAFSADGTYLVTATHSGWPSGSPAELRVWNAKTFDERHALEAQGGQLFSLASVDDQTFVTGGFGTGFSGTVIVWDAREGTRTAELKLGNDIPRGLAVSQDGRMLATGTNGRVAIWNLSDQSKQREFVAHAGLVDALAFAPDGETLATGAVSGDVAVKLWEVNAPPNPKSLTGHTGWVSCLAYSRDGRLLATANRTTTRQGSAQIILWDQGTGDRVAELRVPTRDVYSLDFGPDSRRLAAACDDGAIRLWDVNRSELLGTLKSHEIAVTHVAFSPDGQSLLSGDGEYFRLANDGSYYDTFGRPATVKVWNVAEQRVEASLSGHTGPISGIAFSPTAPLLATSAQDGTLRLWDTRDRRLIRTLKPYSKSATTLGFSPDGRTLAIAGRDEGPDDSGVVKLLDTSTWLARASLVGHGAAVRAVAYSPDGKTLTTGAWDGTVRFWDPRIGQQRLVLRSPQVNVLAFSPDGGCLATGHTNKTVRLWRRN